MTELAHILIVGQPPTCGLLPTAEIFCTYNGVTHVGPPAPKNGDAGVGFLTLFQNVDPLNPCNCAEFFTVPSNPVPGNCTMIPHAKTIMLNADLAPNFPMTSQAGTNNVLDTPALALGTGVDGEFCGHLATNLGSQTAPIPAQFNTNEAVANFDLVFSAAVVGPTGAAINQGFGCVQNSIGDAPSLGAAGAGNVQTLHSSLLPKDPTNTAVSLWETVNSFVDFTLGACVEGISTFNGHFAPYGGSVKRPLAPGSFIGDGATAICNDPTPKMNNGRDNFYREFEIAFTKMTTVGYTYTHTFSPPTITTFTDNAPLALAKPRAAVVNDAINGVSVFTDPVTKTVKPITMVASGNGKLGLLFEFPIGSSSCKTAYPNPCYFMPSAAPSIAPTSAKPSITPSDAPSKAPSAKPSVKPTKAPLSKKPTKAPISKKPTGAPI